MLITEQIWYTEDGEHWHSKMCVCEYLVAKTNQLVTCYGLQYMSPIALFCKKDILTGNTQSWSAMSRLHSCHRPQHIHSPLCMWKVDALFQSQKLFISSIEKLIVDCPRMLSHCSQPICCNSIRLYTFLFWSRHLSLVLCVEKPGFERCEYVVAVMQWL